MIKIYRCILLISIVFLSKESFALACLNNASPGYAGGKIYDWHGQGTMTSSLVTTVAVPSTLPKNSVLWRSPEVSIKVTCWADQPTNNDQNVYVYLSPDDPGYTKLGPDLELGISMNGVDYYCGNGMEVFAGRCRKKLDNWIVAHCYEYRCPENYYQGDLTISFIIIKRSNSAPGKEGSLSGVAGSYGAFQLDGVVGMNSHPDKNFRMSVSGLNQLRYIACDSKLNISPSLINFGSANLISAAPGKTIREVPFVISASKTCNSVYGLNAMLGSINATTPDGYALIPNDNKSVGITLLRETGRVPVPFNKEFVLVKPSGDMVATERFVAALKWNTSEPTLGKFNAGATVDVFYK
ncbi:fimbrial protein [Burkholderia metallica]|uniref:fimbrial protein n=1 Tax=Burkholderia metallica TaxID=488729 RepID=UPI001CF47907|nr:fimbrial protein [Burkholderia metallica]MCA7996624.1 fimbrial protein [Burkholderia metallica]